MEDPDTAKDEAERALRERRLHFYLRGGCRRTDLTATVFGADYRILEVPAARVHTTEELRAVYTGIYQSILPAPFLKTQFRLD